ncbi:unnamed protein product, partial [marine sediment metagenome]
MNRSVEILATKMILYAMICRVPVDVLAQIIAAIAAPASSTITPDMPT